MGQNMSFCCGLCRILAYQIYKKICCIAEPKYLPNHNAICVGLSNVGKSRMLAALNNENLSTVPTTGFNIKSIKLSNCILCVRELGGGDNVRPFWSRYLVNIESLIAVMVVTDTARITEQITNQEQEMVIVFDLQKRNQIPLLIIVCVPNCRLDDNTKLEEVNQALKEYTEAKRCLVVTVRDVVSNVDQIRESMEAFTFKFLWKETS